MKRCARPGCGVLAALDGEAGGAGWCEVHYWQQVGRLRRLPGARDYYFWHKRELKRLIGDPYERWETIRGRS